MMTFYSICNIEPSSVAFSQPLRNVYWNVIVEETKRAADRSSPPSPFFQ